MYFQDVCRVCIKEDVEMMSIFEFYKFHESYLEICEVITNCASVQIHKLDGFSTQICKNCLDDLCRAYCFKQTCEESDYKFRNNLILNDKIISNRLPIIQYDSDEINEKNKDSGLSAISEFYDEGGLLKNRLHDSIDVLNSAVPGSLKGISPAIRDTFPKEDIKMICSKARSNVNKKNEDTLQGYGLIGIKTESYDDDEVSERNAIAESTTLQNLDSAFLASSLETNSNEKSHKCEFCNKSFNGKNRLNVHRRIHTGEMPYNCETCGKGFTQIGNLNVHRRTHTRDKPYKCEICGKCFNQKGPLIIHMNIHTGETNHKCDTCGKCFNRKELLNIHERIHLGYNSNTSETESEEVNKKNKEVPPSFDNGLSTINGFNEEGGALKNQLHSSLGITTSDVLKGTLSGSLEGTAPAISGMFPGEDIKIKCSKAKSNINEECGLINIESESYADNIQSNFGENENTMTESTNLDAAFLASSLEANSIEKSHICKFCNKGFVRKSKLNVHMRTHTGEMPYNCEVCGKGFTQMGNLNVHKRTHRSYKCEICDNCFNEKELLKIHMSFHTGKTLHKCDTCGRCFKQKGHLTTHKMIHTGEKPYTCKTCGNHFNRKELLNIHERIHLEHNPNTDEINEKNEEVPPSSNNGSSTINSESYDGDETQIDYGVLETILQEESPTIESTTTQDLDGVFLASSQETNFNGKSNICEFCNKSFRGQYKLNIHRRIHTGETPYNCDMCGKCFKQKAHLTTHMRIHTGDKPYKCETCGKCFNHKGLLNIHMSVHTGEMPYKCDKCSKSFNQKGPLNTHKMIHRGEKPYKCETCGKCFNRKKFLNIHERIHTGYDPNTCDTCGKFFQHKEHLKIHKRIHTGDKPYKCWTCGKRFREKGLLNIHRITIHTGDNPYKCEICGKFFGQMEDLNIHMNIHTAERYKCDTCGKYFNDEQEINRHYNTCRTSNVIIPSNNVILIKSEFPEEEPQYLYEENSSTESLVKTEPAIIDRNSEEV